jgi:hypothetical protein
LQRRSAGNRIAAERGAHDPCHVINALRASRGRACQEGVGDWIEDVAHYMDPNRAGIVAHVDEGRRDDVKRAQVLQARPRLDAAAMLVWRDIYSVTGPFFRYLGYDKSPLKDEIFCMAETAAPRRSMERSIATGSHVDDVSIRRLPLSFLGCGHQAAVDMLVALLHATRCDYGPTYASMRSACNDVVVCVTDMGGELALADMADILPDWLEAPALLRQDHIFPNTMSVPGPLHIIDWCMRHALERIHWWPVFERQLKATLQFLHPNKRRVKMLHLLKQDTPQQSPEFTHALKATPEKLANWRCGTLWRALSSLARLEETTKLFVARFPDRRVLGVRDMPSVEMFYAAVSAPELWAWAAVTRLILAPLKDLHTWVRSTQQPPALQ